MRYDAKNDQKYYKKYLGNLEKYFWKYCETPLKVFLYDARMTPK